MEGKKQINYKFIPWKEKTNIKWDELVVYLFFPSIYIM